MNDSSDDTERTERFVSEEDEVVITRPEDQDDPTTAEATQEDAEEDQQ